MKVIDKYKRLCYQITTRLPLLDLLLEFPPICPSGIHHFRLYLGIYRITSCAIVTSATIVFHTMTIAYKTSEM